MGAVAARVRAELRSRWKGSVALAVVIAVAVGVVLAAAAGARRTQTAYPRFLEEGRSADVLLSPSNTGLQGYYERVRALPEVQEMVVGAGTPMEIILPSGRRFAGFIALASVDGKFGKSLEQPNLISGTLPSPDDPHAVMINRFFADRFALSPGDRLHAVVFRDAAEDQTKVPLSKSTPITLRVTGIMVTTTDVVPANQLDRQPTLFATRAFYRSFTFRHLLFDGAWIELRPGADLAPFRDEVGRLAKADPRTGGQIFFSNQQEQIERVRQAIAPIAAALALFALLAAVGSFLALSQMVARQTWIDGVQYPTLRALGMTRRQLMAAALARVALVATAGAVAGAVVAAAASPLFPIGPARLAERHPGFAVNWAILGLGALAAVVLLLAAAAMPAWRATRASGSAQGVTDRASRPSRLASSAARAGLPASAAIGVRMAVEPGRGRTAVPVRSALAGLALGVAAVIATSTFGANLQRLVDEPSRYGWNWDGMVDLGFGGVTSRDIHGLISRVPEIAEFSGGIYGNVTIDRTRIPAVGIDTLRGSVRPTIVRGRNPVRPDEIVLGTTTAAGLGAHLGERLDVRLPTDVRRRMRLVGLAVFPTMGQGSFTPTSLGAGAETIGSDFPVPVVTGGDGRPLDPQPSRAYHFVLLRFRAGTDVPAALGKVRALLLAVGCPEDLCVTRGPTPPSEVASYGRVVSTPVLLSALLGALAAALMAHVLVTSVRRRRRDLAVLKTLGFSRRQVGAAVAWQASTLAAIAVLAGVPLGVAAGRWTWTFFASRLGVGTDPTVPLQVLAATAVATVVLANLIAAAPARLAARTPAAALLRTE
jgi:FtsX-like permease family/MacB-like periplasmic core domain